MGEFEKNTLTLKGRNLLAKAMDGKSIHFTRAVMGSGVHDGDADNLVDLIEPELNGEINSIKVKGNGDCEIKVIFDNQNVLESFLFMELGLFAEDPDEGEILYCYAYVKDKTRADYIPAHNPDYTATFLEEEITIYAWISNVENITAVINRDTNTSSEIEYDGQYGELGSNITQLIDSIIKRNENYFTLSQDETPPIGTKVHAKIIGQVNLDNVGIEMQAAYIQNPATQEVTKAVLLNNDKIYDAKLKEEI